MGIQQLVGLIKANLEFLPSWFLAIFWHLVAAIFVVYLLTILFKALSDTAFTTPVKSIGSFTASILRSLLRGAFKAIQSPIERPRTKLAVKILALIHSYLGCVIFFVLTLFVGFLMVVAWPAQDWLMQLSAFGLLFLFFYLTVFFRAEADRDWLALKAQWQTLRTVTSGERPAA